MKSTYSKMAFYATLMAMQSVLIKAGQMHGYRIADNQTPTKRNGGRPTFKRNRRHQLKCGFKARH